MTVLNPDNILELFEMRSALEGLAIRRAIACFDQDAFDELEVRLTRLVRAQGDFNLWISRHNEFHDYICMRSGGQRLFTDVQRLRTAVEPYLRLVLGTPGLGDAVEEHRKLVEVIRAGDQNVAEDTIREHIFSRRRTTSFS